MTVASIFNIYEDAQGMFRWRLTDTNGRIIADSAEGYDSEANVKRAIENVKFDVPGAIVSGIKEPEESVSE